MRILTLNCGSSSVKGAIFDAAAGGAVTRTAEATVELPDGSAAAGAYEAAVDAVVERLRAGSGVPAAIGHRVVHGGTRTAPSLIDGRVLREIEEAERLAPLHNGPALAGIRAVRARFPGMPAVAVFDTAFHASMPAVAARYALPDEIAVRYGVRRYGYHGLAHRSMAERYADLSGRAPQDVAVVTLQLGAGCSAAAVRGRASVDTSMGFTPLEGLVMATRSGDVDPAVVTHLQREAGMTPDEVDDLFNRRSGLLGVSARSADMRELLRAAAGGDERAELAIGMFCYRAAKYVAAYHVALGGAQALVFGGGIGERSPEVRARICAPLAAIGLRIDAGANVTLDGEGRFDAAGSSMEAWVIPPDEARVIATDTWLAVRSAQEATA